MKRILLILCAFANMTNAQVYIPFGAYENLPDSIYTYSGKKLHSVVAISHDEVNRKIVEEGIINDQAHKVESTYTEADGMLKVEKVSSRLNNAGEWDDYMKIVEIHDQREYLHAKNICKIISI